MAAMDTIAPLTVLDVSGHCFTQRIQEIADTRPFVWDMLFQFHKKIPPVRYIVPDRRDVCECAYHTRLMC